MNKRTVLVRSKIRNVGTHRGGIVREDKHLKPEDRKCVVLHERIERYLQDKRGFKYGKAHRIATAFEKQACFRNDPTGWQRYSGRIGALVEKNKR
jgi:hypothetical protein